MLDLEPVKVSTCKGQIFKGYRSLFYHNGRIELRQGVRLMKSLSCPGCDRCGGMDDCIKETLDCGSLIMPEIEHGKLYYVAMVNQSTDWETGYIDSYDLELKPID